MNRTRLRPPMPMIIFLASLLLMPSTAALTHRHKSSAKLKVPAGSDAATPHALGGSNTATAQTPAKSNTATEGLAGSDATTPLPWFLAKHQDDSSPNENTSEDDRGDERGDERGTKVSHGRKDRAEDSYSHSGFMFVASTPKVGNGQGGLGRLRRQIQKLLKHLQEMLIVEGEAYEIPEEWLKNGIPGGIPRVTKQTMGMNHIIVDERGRTL
mmetsp:Transcript_6979/g.10520  ORF Transcript_6979/g.10520 Transcript_6979/m.10520 type:complete len:212 (-) Transcript_6979:282-917(-)